MTTAHTSSSVGSAGGSTSSSRRLGFSTESRHTWPEAPVRLCLPGKRPARDGVCAGLRSFTVQAMARNWLTGVRFSVCALSGIARRWNFAASGRHE